MQVKTSPSGSGVTPEVVAAVKKVIEKRINSLGVLGAKIQTNNQQQLVVRLPGNINTEQAKRILGNTAQLEFRKQKLNTETQLFTLQSAKVQLQTKQEKLRKTQDTIAIKKNQQELQKKNEAIAKLFESTNPPLTGAYLKDAYSEPTSGNGWNIAIRFNNRGGELFANLTKQLAGTGRSIGIFLDQELISAPTVSPEFADNGITGGAAVITGRFTANQANDLSVQLKGGALPAPVEVLSVRKVKENKCNTNSLKSGNTFKPRNPVHSSYFSRYLENLASISLSFKERDFK